MPTISIIVPVYNVEDYVRTCIESVIAQTYLDWELILVDDGSLDRSGLICDEYEKKDNRIKTIHKINGGVSSARNIGIESAIGEWLYFIDSDDFIDRKALEITIQKNNTLCADLIVHGLVDDFIYNGKSNSIRYRDIKDYDYQTIIECVDKYGLLRGPVCKLFKKNIVDRNFIRFDESISYGEDTKFTFQYLLHCSTISFVPEHFYHYCFRDRISLTQKDYSYKNWDLTAHMLLDLRLPIFKKFALSNSYFQFIRIQYLTHISRAIHSMYKKGVVRKDRLEYLRKLKNDYYLQDTHKDLTYLNRLVYLVKYPIMMDLLMICLTVIKKRIF